MYYTYQKEENCIKTQMAQITRIDFVSTRVIYAKHVPRASVSKFQFRQLRIMV